MMWLGYHIRTVYTMEQNEQSRIIGTHTSNIEYRTQNKEIKISNMDHITITRNKITDNIIYIKEYQTVDGMTHT